MRSYAEQQHIMGFQGGLSNPVMDLLLQSIFPMPDLEKNSSGQFIIAGFRDENELVNPEFNYEPQTVISVNNWTGSGEASESTEWEFQDGSFVFSKYLVDETYDGKVNPILVEEE